MLFESPMEGDEVLVRVMNLMLMSAGSNLKEAGQDYTVTEDINSKQQVYQQHITFGFLRNSGMKLSAPIILVMS